MRVFVKLDELAILNDSNDANEQLDKLKFLYEKFYDDVKCEKFGMDILQVIERLRYIVSVLLSFE